MQLCTVAQKKLAAKTTVETLILKTALLKQ